MRERRIGEGGLVACPPALFGRDDPIAFTFENGGKAPGGVTIDTAKADVEPQARDDQPAHRGVDPGA